jgi:hypothetical protein
MKIFCYTQHVTLNKVIIVSYIGIILHTLNSVNIYSLTTNALSSWHRDTAYTAAMTRWLVPPFYIAVSINCLIVSTRKFKKIDGLET